MINVIKSNKFKIIKKKNKIKKSKNYNNIELNISIDSAFKLDKNITTITDYDYNNKKYAIITNHCKICGLFSLYIYNLGCVNKYLLAGYIPIIDMKNDPNMYNNYSTSMTVNPWEYFFEQPFGYKLEETLKNAKRISYVKCLEPEKRPNEKKIYYNKVSINYWHNFAEKYLPIKKEIRKEAEQKIQELFNGDDNILGIFVRGTDYIAKQPPGHPRVPNIEKIISDIKLLDEKYKYNCFWQVKMI